VLEACVILKDFYFFYPVNYHSLVFNPFYALELELFDFHLFRFSFGETTEEVTRKGKSKSYRTTLISIA
jgi:hypothetical protein